MPIYAYRCSACGRAKDVLQKMSDPVLTDCPFCGEPAFVKQVTAAGFQLKGSGWYVTDFRGDSKAPKAADGVGASEGGKTDGDSAAGKADSGKADPGKTGTGDARAGGDGASAAKGATAGAAPAAPAPSAPAAAPSPTPGGGTGPASK